MRILYEDFFQAVYNPPLHFFLFLLPHVHKSLSKAAGQETLELLHKQQEPEQRQAPEHQKQQAPVQKLELLKPRR